MYFLQQRLRKFFLNRKESSKEVFKFFLHEQKVNKVSLMTEEIYKNEEMSSEIFNSEKKVASKNVYYRNLKLNYNHR